MGTVPVNLPALGERCRLRGRGREPQGVLRKVNDCKWAWVDWDVDKPPGPRIVHLHELEKVQ